MQLCGNEKSAGILCCENPLVDIDVSCLAFSFNSFIAIGTYSFCSSYSKKDSTNSDLLSKVKKCEICDFIIHKQSKYISSNILQNALVLSPVTITYNCNACICNYDFTLQGFTNKGPPPLYS